MLAEAKNYDVICLQMRNYLPQQEGSLKRETNTFIDGVKAVIMGDGQVKQRLDKFIPKIFNYRLLALKWISQQADIDLDQLLKESSPSLEKLKNNPKLRLLAENALFAVRCNLKLAHATIGKVTSEKFSQQIVNIPSTTYEQFFGTLALNIPDQETFQTILDFSHASLYIEFILLAAILIDEDNMNISEDTINELAFLIADAAQDYSAIAAIMGILPVRQQAPTLVGTPINSDEDQLLSNLGLSDFAKNF